MYADDISDIFDVLGLDHDDLVHIGVVLQCLSAFVFIWTTGAMLWRSKTSPAMRSVAVLVLGDVGRSPRMMYHAESFARSGFDTFVVGYEGAKPIASLLVQPRVVFCYLPELPKALRFLPFLLLAPIKITFQVVSILYTFMVGIPTPPEYIIVQNPPSIPTLALVQFISFWRGCKVIIDWHNLGYTILGLRFHEQEPLVRVKHPLVRIAQMFEAFFGRKAYAHLFVTQAMHDYLNKNWVLRGRKVVLHDRPPSHFHRAEPSEVHDLFLRLDGMWNTSQVSKFLPTATHPYSTSFTEVLTSDGASAELPAIPSANVASSGVPNRVSAGFTSSPLRLPKKRADRPALVVSSTSWTPDEDFSILLDALKQYEGRARVVNELKPGTLPKLLCIITGKGPLKEKYMGEIAMMQSGKGGEKDGKDEQGWKWVRCVSLWLEPEDYPLLLGSADIGVSLHSSSSALDLPMKVVDMFGCGLPVCALNFPCLDELVKDGHNGLIFSNADQLAHQFEALLTGFPHCPTLEGLQSSLQRRSDVMSRPDEWNTWTENWDQIVRPLVVSDAGSPRY